MRMIWKESGNRFQMGWIRMRMILMDKTCKASLGMLGSIPSPLICVITTEFIFSFVCPPCLSCYIDEAA